MKSVLNKISDKEGLKIFLPDTNYLDEKDIFNGAIKNNLGYAELLKFFALYQYSAFENDVDKINLQSWLRIVRNLVEAHRLYYDNANIFADSLLFLSELITERNNIIEYFKNSVKPEDKGFPKFIIQEEKTKANLILQNEEWKTAIIEIENHGYFTGQIGFLLDWCKEENGYNLDKFREYSKKMQAIFDDKGLVEIEEKTFLFERALFTFGNYLLKKGQNYSFLINSDRDISWKRLLRDSNENKRELLKNLLDKIEITTLKEDLIRIIDEFTDHTDWKFNFIKQPEIILACGPNKFIRKHNDYDILLLNSTTTSGYHREYYSYSLFVKLKNILSLNDNSYMDKRSIDDWKYFEYKGKQIAFDCNSKKYVWTVNNQWDLNEEFDSRDEIIVKLSSM